MSAEIWETVDSRTGMIVGMYVYPTRKSAEATIAGWVARDARGGRPDLHELMPFVVARKRP